MQLAGTPDPNIRVLLTSIPPPIAGGRRPKRLDKKSQLSRVNNLPAMEMPKARAVIKAAIRIAHPTVFTGLFASTAARCYLLPRGREANSYQALYPAHWCTLSRGGPSMRTTIVRTGLSLVCLLIASATANATWVYELVQHEGFDIGWSLEGGTITTDMTTNDITADNIEAWSVTFTSPLGTSTLTSANGQLVLDVSDDYPLLASDTQIWIEHRNPDPTTTESFTIATFELQELTLVTFYRAEAESMHVGLSTSAASPTTSSISEPWAQGDRLLIAERSAALVVPEPSTIFIWGGLSLALAAWAVHRRETRAR